MIVFFPKNMALPKDNRLWFSLPLCHLLQVIRLAFEITG